MPDTPPDLSSRLLGEQYRTFFLEHLEKVFQYGFAGPFLPSSLAGYPVRYDVLGDLLYCLGHARELGATEIAGVPLEEIARRLLRALDGPATETFYSYRVAETLLRWGSWDENPLLEGFSAAETKNVEEAVDSTQIWRRKEDDLNGRPNNYWGVLARCEVARQKLGLIKDSDALRVSLGHIHTLLTKNSTGFFDDGKEGEGRFDIYSYDVHLFAESFWERLDEEALQRNLRAHGKLFETSAFENGACVAWGRSTGLLAVLLTIEFAALLVANGLGQNVPLLLARLHNATHRLPEWFDPATGLVRAYHYRSPYGYRGPQRYVQLTLDSLGKIAYAATKLLTTDERASLPSRFEVFPAHDELVQFEENRSRAVWTFRNDSLAFQLPFVNGWRPDYQPVPFCPGLFETPVDEDFTNFLPVVRAHGKDFTILHSPEDISHAPHRVQATWKTLVPVPRRARDSGPDELPVNLTLTWTVDADEIRFGVDLQLPEAANGTTWRLPEVGRRCDFFVESNHCHFLSTTPTAGMKPWRSFWHEITRVHEVHFDATTELAFTVNVRPRLRIAAIPGDHDYVRALYEPLLDTHDITWIRQQRHFEDLPVAELAKNHDILHLGWPEHLFHGFANDDPDYFAKLDRWLDELARSRLRVIWTMHNRRPHKRPDERGQQLFERWARVVDGVQHHSAWGQQLAREEFPYRPDALHEIVPHGHFGKQMQTSLSRAEIEQQLGLRAGALRIGLLGLYQSGKQIEKFLEAFAATDRQDFELLLTAAPPDCELPEDSRIVRLPRPVGRLFTREELAAQVHACDILVAIPRGETYLTTGQVADSLGTGVPLLTNDWEFLREVMGDAAIVLDDTSAETLRAGLQALTRAQVEAARPFVTERAPRFAWPELAPQLDQLLRRVGAFTSG